MTFKLSPPSHRIMRASMFLIASVIIVQLTVSPKAIDLVRQDPTPTSDVVIPDGTEFTVITIEEITSKTATEGDPLSFKVAEDVKINGHIVISKDTLVKGVVSNAKKAGMMGSGGKLGIRIESTTTVDNQKVKLRSSKGKEGDDKTGTTVALVVLFGPLGLLKHGKNAKIKSGTEIKVYTDEEKKVQIKN